MTSTGIIIAFIIAIVLMVLAISKFKVHAAMAILIIVLGLGVVIGIDPPAIVKTVQSGFGKTIGDIGIVILLGCLLGKVLEETGAAVSITNSTLKIFGKKNVIWAIVVSSAILGIPVFADSVVIVLMPVVSTLALQTGASMAQFGTVLYLGAYITHSLVPPTPGPLAAAALLGVDLGQAILWGIVVSVPAVIAATLYCKTLKFHIDPKEEFIKTAKNITDPAKLPGLFVSYLPIIIPIVLIMVSSMLNAVDKEAPLAKAFGFVGSPLVALLIGVIFSLILTGKEWKSKKVLNDWVEDGLKMSAMPIIVTGLGGALALLIKDAKVAEQLADAIGKSGIPPLFIPFIISAVVNTITGSNTLGVMTGAAIMQPLLPNLDISALATFLACASGAQIFKHTNSSGFWVTASLSNMNLPQALRSIGGATAASGIASFIAVFILNIIGLI
ncbi:Na+/H+ antiporter NhaC family protein [Petroclostridium sp. X23]|uniref:GntP family permease n=1 Tax=Petroclostridium sp. X23 TaxID=3045146 RepID=UPI0024AD64A6|nr:Na+/H+ antiporter NhaC family protein [Petroclostridium sp. X23]WHH61285.1 SLC13 family permease [Petroclostridium sp. X23]